MIYGIFALLLIQNVVLIGALIVSRRKLAAVEKQFIAFVSPTEDGKPSPLATVVETVTQTFAKQLTKEVGMALRTGASAVARSTQAIEGDIMLEAASAESPVLGAILEQFPTLKKIARKHPGLFEYAVDVAAKAMAGKQAGSSSPGTSGGGVADPYAHVNGK